MNRCDLAGAGVMLMIWIVAGVIQSAFDKQLGEAGGFLLLIFGAVGIFFGVNVRKQCKERPGAPPPA